MKIFGIDFAPDWLQFQKNIGMVGAYAMLLLQNPDVAAQCAACMPIIKIIAAVATVLGINAHRTDDKIYDAKN